MSARLAKTARKGKNPAPGGSPCTLGPILATLKLKRIGSKVWPFLRDRGGLLHGVTFILKRAEGSVHGEGCLQDVQTALCTSANRWCANLYTYIGLMVPVYSEWYVSGSFLCNLGPKAALPRYLLVSRAFFTFSNYSYNFFP